MCLRLGLETAARVHVAGPECRSGEDERGHRHVRTLATIMRGIERCYAKLKLKPRQWAYWEGLLKFYKNKEGVFLSWHVLFLAGPQPAKRCPVQQRDLAATEATCRARLATQKERTSQTRAAWQSFAATGDDELQLSGVGGRRPKEDDSEVLVARLNAGKFR